MNNILSALEKRSSTRGYTAEKLTEAELESLLEAGLQAPTAANRQEIHISVVDGSHPNWLVGGHQKSRANECIKCGKCEEACPQHIAIRENLDKVCRELIG